MTVISWTESYGDEMFQQFNMSELQRDEAYVNVFTGGLFYLYSVYKECYKCPFTRENKLKNNTTLKINTHYPKLWRILISNVSASPQNSSTDVMCNLDDTHFGEFGVYKLNVSEEKCVLETLKEPVNIYFPILTVFLIYLATLSFIYGAFYIWNKKYRRSLNITKNSSSDEKETQNKRIRSLDTFRGITIVLMVFVNYGCGGYAFLDHAVWNGLHVADLIFPWFMWIMGVCIPLSVASGLKKDVSKKTALRNVVTRSAKLFWLGLFLGASPYLVRLRVFGVLQRFGICYLIVASMCIIFMKKDYGKSATLFRNIFKDILVLKYQWICAIAVLLCHCLIIFTLPVPDCPSGYLGPGGLHDDGTHFKCTGGATGYMDEIILGNHRYRFPTIKEIYKSQAFDPEGIVGCLTSLVQVFLGVQAGSTLLCYKEHGQRLQRWLIWALLLGIIGGCLCGFSKEEGFVPLNKNLWSLSFVLVTSSFAFILLFVCYYIVDVQNWWSGKPFLFAGMNAIIIYVGHSLCHNNFPIRWIPSSELNTHFIMLIENIWATGFWILVSYYLYRIKVFFTV